MSRVSSVCSLIIPDFGSNAWTPANAGHHRLRCSCTTPARRQPLEELGRNISLEANDASVPIARAAAAATAAAVSLSAKRLARRSAKLRVNVSFRLRQYCNKTTVAESLITEAPTLGSNFDTLEKAKASIRAQRWPSHRSLSVDDFLAQTQQQTPEGRMATIFDVRSPGEFQNGHIPGAVSLPLLNDDARAEVGKLFRCAGPDKAFELAVKRAYPGLEDLLAEAHSHCSETGFKEEQRADVSVEAASQSVQDANTAPAPRALVYCKRGGLRSQSVATLLSLHGLSVHTLQGGYKAFRGWAMSILEQSQPICAVAGATGSGKTEVLKELKRLGHQVLDLEAIACHKGSVFGHLGEPPQPSSEQVRNLIAMEWARVDRRKFLYIEDEHARIGSVCLPAPLYQQMRSAQLLVHLDVPFGLRSERTLAVYGQYGVEGLSRAVGRFEPRMGRPRVQELQAHLEQGELRPVCEAALRVYNAVYERHRNIGRSVGATRTVAVDSLDSMHVAAQVVEAATPLEEHAADVAEQAGVAQQAQKDEEPKPELLQVREARCFCGATLILVHGDPLSVSICHCSICRSLSGAPFVVSALFKPANVAVTGSPVADTPALTTLQTSPSVTRQRCATCHAPIAAKLGQKFIAVPLGLFQRCNHELPPQWHPVHHLHYESRVMDVNDGLPKFLNRARGPRYRSPETITVETTKHMIN